MTKSKYQFCATMLYMSAFAVSAEALASSPEPIHGSSFHTLVVDPNNLRPAKDDGETVESIFDETVENALEAGWHLTTAEALAAADDYMPAEPVPVDEDTQKQIADAIAENEGLVKERDEVQAQLNTVTQERDDTAAALKQAEAKIKELEAAAKKAAAEAKKKA